MARRINAGYDADGKLKPKKIDYNANPEVNLKKLHDGDKGKVPLRITKTLTILVSPDKATPEYAEQYRQKMYENSLNW